MTLIELPIIKVTIKKKIEKQLRLLNTIFIYFRNIKLHISIDIFLRPIALTVIN